MDITFSNGGVGRYDIHQTKKGSLSPWSQAVIVALLKMKKKHFVDMSFSDIAGEVTKVGGEHPSKQAVAELATNVAKDDQWYPGKVAADAKKRGPKKKFTRAKQLQVAKAAMAPKRSGAEVSVGAMLARTPNAATNPLYTARIREHLVVIDKW